MESIRINDLEVMWNEPILKVNDKNICAIDLFSVLLMLLIGHLSMGRKYIEKVVLSSEVEKARFIKIIFDEVLEETIVSETIFSTIRDKDIEETEDMILLSGNLFGLINNLLEEAKMKDLSRFLCFETLKNNFAVKMKVSAFLDMEIEKSGIVSFETIKNFYKNKFAGFPILSFLFASLLKGDNKAIIEMRKKFDKDKPLDVEKECLVDPSKIVYYYENINVFDYVTSTEDFESKKMLDLYEVLEILGIDEFSQNLENKFKINKTMEIRGNKRTNLYRFFKIDYSKPEFDDGLYRYLRNVIYENFIEEFRDKTFNDLSENVKIEFFEKHINVLRRFFEKFTESVILHFNSFTLVS